MEIPHRRQGQHEQDEIGENVGRGADDEEQGRIDTGSFAAFVPSELHGAALEGADQDHHDTPADGEDSDDVGQILEVAEATEYPDVEEEDGEFDDGDGGRPDDFRGVEGLESWR